MGGTPTIQYVTHIESYVSSSSSAAQQAASIDAIALLVKNDLLSLETLVREMEMYLTTTDSIIRARGILLLGELLMRLTSKPLGDTAISSLIEFFTERLADWKALHGALVGCLALLRRKADTGMINKSQAKAVAESYLKSLQVQSLGQQDRKLCFQILECLLDCYRDALVSLGDDLVYGICEAIDGEKDPQCLMLIFHIVELLAQLFPEASGPLANFAGDLFEILECYFPIHFTHPKSDDVDIQREELSRALMLAFASTPLFEPSVIPLLLDKLSSSLPSAKVESLKYLSYCTSKYGGDRMDKYTESLWSALKDALFTCPHSTLSVDSDPIDGLGFHESEIMTQALELLQVLVRQHNNSFLSLILGDGDISTFLNSFSHFDDFNSLSTQYKQRLHAVGHVLSVCIKASGSSCNKVFESFFPRLVDALRLSVENSHVTVHSTLDENFHFGALYLCVELLAACRQLVVSSDKVTSAPDLARDSWCQILHSFGTSLCNVFICLIRTSCVESTWNAYVYAAVKGLEILPESHEEKFNELKQQLQVPSTKMLTLDDRTQWNTTYEMLLAATELKEVFSCLDTLDPDYKDAPTLEDWKQVETLCTYLKIFFDTANLLTEPTSPTTNTFFHEAWKIQLELARAAASEDPFTSSLTKMMQEKFDNYWKSCCLMLAIAVVMDPRFKMKLVEFSYSKIYGEEAATYVKTVEEGIHELFNEYVALPLPLTPTYVEEVNGSAMRQEDGQGLDASCNGLGLTDFDVYIMETSSQQSRSELDQYLEESLLPRVHEFDVVGWWKLNRMKYPTLSKMARDILSVPVSTVTADSIFSTVTKEMDSYRCSLRPETVEALICAKDWLQNASVDTLPAPIKMEVPI